MNWKINILFWSLTSFVFTQNEVPEDFEYKQSTLQAFYYFTSVTLNGLPIENEDWVGAFNGDVCVGSIQWDTSQCGNGVCDVPVLGDEGNDFTEGYMQNGDIPTFKIYDVSEDTYYDAIPSEEFPWENFGFNFADNLNGFILGCTNMSACNYNAAAEIEPNDSCLFPCATAGGCTTADDAYDCSGVLSVEQLGANLPEEFSITNIYPNPFNPVTTINYGMQKNAAVKILIYNIVGEEIASLVNTYQTAGHHSVIWNADMHSGGMYLVKMIAGRHVYTKKLMLIK